MNQAEVRIVTDANGLQGIVETLPDPPYGAHASVGVRLENGQKLLLPMSVLITREDGTFYLPFALDEFVTASHSATFASSTGTTQTPVSFSNLETFNSQEHQPRTNQDEIVIPVAAEHVAVGKRVVETGRVRITKTVEEREQTVDVPLLNDHVEVERVAVNRVLDTTPEVRREGETLIVPILEEVLVVEKRLMLREELHIRMRREEVRQPQSVVLRREEVQIERFRQNPSEPALISEDGGVMAARNAPND